MAVLDPQQAARKRAEIAQRRREAGEAAAVAATAKRAWDALVQVPDLLRGVMSAPPPALSPPWPHLPGRGTVLVFHGAELGWSRDAGLGALLEELRVQSQCPVVLVCERVPAWMRAGGAGGTGSPWGAGGAGPGSTNLLGDPSLHPESPALGSLPWGSGGGGGGYGTMLRYDEDDWCDEYDGIEYDDLDAGPWAGARGRGKGKGKGSGRGRKRKRQGVGAEDGLAGPVPCLLMSRPDPSLVAGVLAAATGAFMPRSIVRQHSTCGHWPHVLRAVALLLGGDVRASLAAVQLWCGPRLWDPSKGVVLEGGRGEQERLAAGREAGAGGAGAGAAGGGLPGEGSLPRLQPHEALDGESRVLQVYRPELG